MIIHQNSTFHLSTDAYSYLFRVNDYGILEHLHFGAPVAAADVQALACKPGTGWGSSVSYDVDQLYPPYPWRSTLSYDFFL